MRNFKRILALFLVGVVVFSLASCGDAPEKNTGKAVKEKKTEAKTEKIPEEEPVELIYAKTPEEAAEKCLNAVYSGNLDDAKHYVEYNGNAFKELTEFKGSIMKSYKADSSAERKAKVEAYILNFFSKFSYSEKSSNVSGDEATVVYSVSMPDISQINYSTYMDSYMLTRGFTPETLMTELEGMNEKESEDWSLDFALDVMNYVFESNAEISMIDTQTTVYLKKGKEGWIVTEIQNLAG